MIPIDSIVLYNNVHKTNEKCGMQQLKFHLNITGCDDSGAKLVENIHIRTLFFMDLHITDNFSTDMIIDAKASRP